MIRVICPNCQAKLNAKEELVGQTRNCPRCGGTVVVKRPDEQNGLSAEFSGPVPPASESPSAEPHEIDSGHIDAPLRLTRLNRYLVCDGSRVIAAWENNGQGWRIRTDHGFASASRNPEKIPTQGDFRLVELKMVVLGDELRLKAIQVYQLTQRWALTGIARGDDLICKSIVGPGTLLRAQKNAVRLQLQELFMRPVWGEAAEVLDYLANDDYHSHGAGA